MHPTLSELMATFWTLWFLGAMGVFGVLESVGVLDKKEDTTLSANWWRIRMNPFVSAPFLAGWLWVLHHLWNPYDTHTGGWDDICVIVTGLVLGLAIRYRKRRHGA